MPREPSGDEPSANAPSTATLDPPSTLTEPGQPWRTTTPDPPRRLGRFEISGRLGAGGMGEVYEAIDPRLERRVAIKVVGAAREGSGAQARLLREARVLARLAHPNIVAIYDADLHDGQLFLALELVRGADLRAWLAAQPRSRREVMAVLEGAFAGVFAAHEVGVTHRDIKPDNILVGEDGRARVADFGIARAGEDPAIDDAGASPPARGAAARLTRTGAVMGTPVYMAPEVVDGESPGALADQWSLCATAYEALSGERLLTRPHADQHATAAARVLADRRIPRRIRRVLARGLADVPAQRFADVKTAASALRRAHRGRPAARALAAVIVVAIAAIVVVGARRETSAPRCDGAATRVAGVWSPARRAAIDAAFARSGAPGAAATATYLAAQIERQLAGWSAAATDACRATHVRGEQSAAALDLRMSCLDRRLGELDAVLARYSEGVTPAEVAAAPEVVDRLPSVAACADPRQLAAVIPLPASPAARRAIEDGRDALDRVRADHELARFDAARALLDRAEAAVSTTTYPPLVAELALWRARLTRTSDDPQAATEHALRALHAAVAAGDAALEAEAWLSLVDIERQRGELRAALATARAADVALARAGEPAHLVARYHNILGGVHYREGRLVEARAAYERAAELWRELAGPRSVVHATALFNLAGVAYARGHADESLRLAASSIEILEERFGPDHLDLSYPLTSMGLTELDRGHLEAAERHLGRVLAIRRAHHPGGHSDLAFTLAQLASVAAVRGDVVVAEGRMHEAIAMMRALHGGDGLDTAEIVINLADGMLAAGDLERAAAAMREARAVLAARPDLPVALDRALTLTEGRWRLARGEAPAGRRLCEAAAARRAGLPDDEPEAAAIALCLGTAAAATGDRAAAAAHLERAATIADGASLPTVQAEARLRLARLRAPTDRAAARATAEAGLAGLVGFEGEPAARLRQALVEIER